MQIVVKVAITITEVVTAGLKRYSGAGPSDNSETAYPVWYILKKCREEFHRIYYKKITQCTDDKKFQIL
jgi:hypothetical protein